MNNKILTLVMTLVLGVILAGSLLVPVIKDTTEVNRTFTNEGLWRMNENENGLTYTHDLSNSSWSLNDEVQYSGDIITDNSAKNVIVADSFMIRANGWIRGTNVGGNYTTSVTVADDVMELVGGGLSGTTTQSISGYGYDKEGTYLMTAYDKAAYLKGDDQIYCTELSTLDTVNFITHLEGTIDGGITITAAPQSSTATITDFSASNIVLHTETVSEYVDLYSLSGISADVSFTYKANADADAVEITGVLYYASYVVPYEVTAERSVHLNSGEISLMNAIPIMVIVALLMAAVGAIALRRAD